MKAPNNQIAEVLYQLLNYPAITRDEVTKRTGIANITARIADLRIKYNIDVICTKIAFINKHGRDGHYGSWSLDPTQKAVNIEKYEIINRE